MIPKKVTFNGFFDVAIWIFPIAAAFIFFSYLDTLLESQWVHKKGDLSFFVITFFITNFFLLPLFRLTFKSLDTGGNLFMAANCLGFGVFVIWKIVQHWIIFICKFHSNLIEDPAFGFFMLGFVSLLALLIASFPLIFTTIFRSKGADLCLKEN